MLIMAALRSIMTDDRVTGLAVMYIHPEVEIDVGEIIRRFTAMPSKSRPAWQTPTADIDATEAHTPQRRKQSHRL